MSKDDAINLANARATEHHVAGYGRQDDGYGGPYHPDAFKQPHTEFAAAGDPEVAEEWTKELTKLDKKRAKDQGIDKVDLVAASSHSTVVENQPYRAADVEDDLVAPATNENVAIADERKPVHKQAPDVRPNADNRVAEPEKPKAETKVEPKKNTEPERRPAKKTAAKKS